MQDRRTGLAIPLGQCTLPAMPNPVAVVAIDGPSGAGKSTLARAIAEELGLLYADTGAMYRALGLAFQRRNIPFEEGPVAHQLLGEIQFRYSPPERPEVLVEIDGEDWTRAIREHPVADWASRASALPCVRHYLLDYQRGLPRNRPCVMEGRDVGSVVFPRAFCKFFVTANARVRAQRRWQQLHQLGQTPPSVDQILKDLQERDQRDRGRGHAPLVQMPDATVLDTSTLTPSQAQAQMATVVRQRAALCQLVLP